MWRLFRQLGQDEYGVILSAEIVLVGTLLVVGMITGMACLRQAVDDELRDVGAAIGSLDQSYSFGSVRKVGWNSRCCAFTAGSSFIDCRRSVTVDQGRCEVSGGTWCHPLPVPPVPHPVPVPECCQVAVPECCQMDCCQMESVTLIPGDFHLRAPCEPCGGFGTGRQHFSECGNGPYGTEVRNFRSSEWPLVPSPQPECWSDRLGSGGCCGVCASCSTSDLIIPDCVW